MKKTSIQALKADVFLQGILLSVTIGSFLFGYVGEDTLIIAWCGEILLGIYQMISAICFAVWFIDFKRVIYVVVCISYLVLAFFLNPKGLFGEASVVVPTIIVGPLMIATFYFLYNLHFYRKAKEN